MVSARKEDRVQWKGIIVGPFCRGGNRRRNGSQILLDHLGDVYCVEHMLSFKK